MIYFLFFIAINLPKFWIKLYIGFLVLSVLTYRYYKTERGKAFFDKFFLKLPFFGPLLQAINISRFAENLSTSITFESVNQGLVEFPRKEGRNAVDLRLSPEKEKEVFGLVQRLKKDHPSINNSKSYVKLFQTGRVKYHCHIPKISLRVEPDGSVTNCQDRDHPIGNVYQEKLASILSSPTMKWLQRKAEACSSCVDSGVIESSLFWDFNLEVMANTLRLFMK